ncbi:MAG: TAXI family TRAP transporter solute-binding subunit [Proteobacteria bacterium]|nr:TAXI family TRAP transporter solute-binding subunit [Pseudomonadota bacterium]
MARFVSRLLGIVTQAALVLAMLSVSGTARGNELIQFSIGTGAIAGTYHPIGSLIVNIISQPPGSRACEDGGGCGVPNLVATTQSSQGSVANVRAIQDGRILSGFSQADVAHDMVAGSGAFAGMPPLDKVRGLANLYPENLHIVVRRGAGIRSIADLPGKRVSMDVLGSGTRFAAETVLAAYGLTDSDVISVNGTSDQAATLMRKGELDAFIVVAGTPARAVTTLTRDSVAAVVGLGEDQMKAILADHRFFSRSTILDGIYEGVSGVSTIAVGAQWLISADVPEDLVHDICRALWSDSARIALDKGHPQGRHIQLSRALDGISIPLHPGATRCYRELGLIK